MFAATPSTPLRKGTKSCTECRRRKVRCTWTSEEAPACRRCEERGSTCVPQVHNRSTASTRILSSRDRISRLEAKVDQLSNIVSDLQVKLGCDTTRSLVISSAQDDPRDDMNDAEDDEERGSSASEVVAEDRPSHLYSLFQNDVLSIDAQETVRDMHERSSKAAAVTLDAARSVLQRLMPPKEDVYAISGSVSQWHRILHEVFPLTSLPKSQQDLLTSYDIVIQPETDTMALASWLLGVAMVSQQVRQEAHSPDSIVRAFQKRFSFARVVSEAVESHILSHDSLIGTVEGIELALLYLRAQMSWGHMHKVWLNFRRVIAVAEMIGLPRAAKIAESQNNQDASLSPLLHVKASLWTSICSIERLACVLHNFPCATLRYSPAANQPLVIHGIVQPRIYMLRLSNIAAKVQDLDDLSMGNGIESEVYASVLRVDSDLRLLATGAPGQWWGALPNDMSTAHLLQFLHNVMVMRTHLFFMIRRDPQDVYSYSQQAGSQACCEVLQRWQTMRRSLPLGFFLCRVIDLQAFTAAILLLLASESARTTNNSVGASNHTIWAECVKRTVELLREKAQDPVGSDIAREAVQAIQSLTAMLENRDDNLAAGYLKLTVPRLGKIHVRRNPETMQRSSGMTDSVPQQVLQSQTWQSAARPATQSGAAVTLPVAMHGMQTQELWNQDPFSWFIEDDYGAMFEDTILDTNFGQAGTQ